MQTGIFPGSEVYFFPFCRNFSKRHGAYSSGPSQLDRTRGWSVPWQEMFLAEGLSPPTWQVGWGSAGSGQPFPAWMESSSLSTQQNAFALQKHLSLSYISVTDKANITWVILVGFSLCSEFSFIMGCQLVGWGGFCPKFTSASWSLQ